MNLNVFAIKTVCFLALSFLLFLCHSALLSVIRFLQRMLHSQLRTLPPWTASSVSSNDVLMLCMVLGLVSLGGSGHCGLSSPSCVSPGVFPECYATGTICMYFILAWWIFKPHGFLHTLPQKHCVLVVVFTSLCVAVFWSVWMESSFFIPFRDSWGYFSVICSL